ncbi:MAG TPA: threonine synthase [Steroidobacteraceae bacterium]|nr:threonine synthase [Steroidobacteraceae bacterium]
MQFQSTRQAADNAPGGSATTGFAQALLKGLAPDGGLYVPQRWPVHEPARLCAQVGLPPQEYLTAAGLARIGALLLAPLVGEGELAAELPAITAQAFSFPAPVVPLEPVGRHGVLELFHGPTAAFKDFGARFLAACLSRLRAAGQRPLNILVATSGDTGGAVAAAFHRLPGVQVSVLFPKGLVSPTQEHQLTCWGDNVRSFAVRGTFDDCQRMVKAAFMDRELNQRYELSSANSINLGRLLPQAVYYAAASLQGWSEHGEPVSFVVPSGNLGNAVAGLWARRLGMPVNDIVLAHNANRTVPDLLASGTFQPRPSIATLASAMDVGNPSNLERLRALYPDIAQLRAAISADVVTDEQIRARIRRGFEQYGQIWCPHTATAAEVYARLPESRRTGGRWVVVATAHPAKFREIVEPLIGRPVPVPDSLARLFELPAKCVEIAADLDALRRGLA